MALGYRHWAGISVQEVSIPVFCCRLADAQNCHTALDYYEAAANRGESILSIPKQCLMNSIRDLPIRSTRRSDLTPHQYSSLRSRGWNLRSTRFLGIKWSKRSSSSHQSVFIQLTRRNRTRTTRVSTIPFRPGFTLRHCWIGQNALPRFRLSSSRGSIFWR
jgi:hypothetical protein